MVTIGQNLAAATDRASVDRLNAHFYDCIQYPPPAICLERFGDPELFSVMVGHDIGYANDSRVLPPKARIWVAGCGRNQALVTALRFPQASVVGSDLSTNSLATCAEHARQLGVRNLELHQESLNEVTYDSDFDYVLCTGVIHHNAYPQVALARVANALRPTGVLELMVYNEYHRLHSASFQQVVRLLARNAAEPDYVKELPLSKRLIGSFEAQCSMNAFLRKYTGEDTNDIKFADTLLQPVEYSYTVQSLNDLTSACNLEMLTFCVDQFSRNRGAITWNLELRDADLLASYLSLPDVTRWHITNLMLQEASPMLWFYFQRRDCPRTRKTEQQTCDEFLETRFRRISTTRQTWTLAEDGVYRAASRPSTFPPRPPSHPEARKVYDALNESEPIGKTLATLGLDTSFSSVNRLRVSLASSAFPFIASRERC